MHKAFRSTSFVFMLIALAGCRPLPVGQNQITPTQTTIQIKPPIEVTHSETPIRPNIFDPIALAWFYKPPAVDELGLIAKNYDFFILTRMDEKERDFLSNRQPQMEILQYLLMGEIQDPGSCTKQPYHNQVAEQVGDYCMLVSDHREWFLKDTFGNIVMNDEGYQLMDPSNLGWRKFWMDRMIISQEKLGWRGVFLDNVEASLEKRIRYGAIPKEYPTDSSYQEAIEGFLESIYTEYFQPNQRPLYANIISLNDPSVWGKYLKYLDGAMIENFAVGWEDYKDPSAWEMDLQLAEQAQSMGKKVILVSQGEKSDSDRQVFALASFLLVNNGLAYFRYTNDQYYDEVWSYENYHYAFGSPKGIRYQDGKSWVREFDHGKVTVNPSTLTAEIRLY